MFERYFRNSVISSFLFWIYDMFALKTSPIVGLFSALLFGTTAHLLFPIIGLYYRILRKKVKFL